MQKRFQQYHIHQIHTTSPVCVVLDFDRTELDCLMFPLSNATVRFNISSFENPFRGNYSFRRAFDFQSQMPQHITKIIYSIMAMDGDGKTMYSQAFEHDFERGCLLDISRNEMRSTVGNLFKRDKLNFLMDTKAFPTNIYGLQFIA